MHVDQPGKEGAVDPDLAHRRTVPGRVEGADMGDGVAGRLHHPRSHDPPRSVAGHHGVGPKAHRFSVLTGSGVTDG
jgi:hypothetical protein